MKKTWLVAKNELVKTIFRPSFIIALLSVPVFMIVIMWISFQGAAGGPSVASPILSDASNLGPKGVVDLSGTVKSIPEELKDKFVLFSSSEAAREAVKKGEVQSYYQLEADYMATGKITYFREDFNPMAGWDQSQDLNRLIKMNLLPDKPDLYARSLDLFNRVREQVGETKTQDSESFVSFILPYAITFMLYGTIFGSAQYLLNSITDEKQNRVMEVLASSVTPSELMNGKILALGLVGVIQTALWLGIGLIAYRIFSTPGIDLTGIQLTPTFFISFVIYFVLGYLVYASLMAAIGALVPSLKEASQMTFVVIIPLILPLMMISEIGANPNGIFSTIMSLFPLTSPVSMPARMSISTVPLWQLGSSIVILLGTTWLLMRSAAGVFRAQNLLTGKAVSVKVLFQALMGRG